MTTATRTIVVIDGIDGSGKSTFANRLRLELTRLGCPAAILSVDDFRRPIAWNELAGSELDAYYDRYYDFELGERCLQTFLAGGQRIEIPSYDSVTETLRGTRELVFDDARVVVIEGVFPLRLRAAASGTVIRLEVSRDVARGRIIARDMKKRRTREETERRIDRRYFPAQDRYKAACQPVERAHVVIDNERPEHPITLRRDLGSTPQPLRELLDELLPPLR